MRFITRLLLFSCLGFMCMKTQVLRGQDRYWISFTDKGDISAYRPTDLLSPSALKNRQLKGISLDHFDYPVNPEYTKALEMMGIRIKNRSRWFNAVSAFINEEDISQLLKLPFVEGIRPVRGSQRIAEVHPYQIHPESIADTLPFLGSYRNQLNMIGLDSLQELGFRGAGITIAVFDNGFLGVDTIQAFRHLFTEGRILAERDFVDADDSVYESCIHCRHGTQVLSILAALVPNAIQGSAPDASYILLRTENDASETPQEEDNWVAAAEYADSLGAQVFSTSLGYLDFFNNPADNYSREDLDGNTALITRAADIAASRGIIVVNSAGNEAEKGIAAPADGDSVIAVGAVNELKNRASFSSFGYTVDNRIKPDIMAVGEGTYLVNYNGRISRGSGTSFSCPILSGMLACVLQAHPGTSYGELYEALIRSADRFNQPDAFYGYGVPSAMTMYALLSGPTVSTRTWVEKGRWKLFPNPNSGTFSLSTLHSTSFDEILLEISNLDGKLVYSQSLFSPGKQKNLLIQLDISPGFYVYSLKNYREDVYIDSGKLIIVN